jgi:predicted DNA-binding transcriptional regulator AlpA
MTSENLVHSPEQVARQLGLSTSTLAKLRLSGNGPAYIKLGGRRVGYRPKDIEEWLERSRRISTSQEVDA